MLLKKYWFPRLVRPLLVASAAAALAFAFVAPLSAADTIKLDDGSELVGTIEPMGSGRYVKIVTEDGETKLLPSAKIASVNGKPYGDAAASGTGAGGAGEDGAGARPGVIREGLGRDYENVKDRCDRVALPVEAVDRWERFLAGDRVSEAERIAGEAELAKWKILHQDGAERLRGGWLGGDELKKLKEDSNKLIEEGLRLEQGNNILDAISSYREALKIYPNAFRPHYRMGYIAFHQGYGQEGGNPKLRQAESHARMALKLQPQLPAVLSSMGACLFVLDKNEEGIEYMWKAVQIAETELTVGNLLSALDYASSRGWLRANRRLTQINQSVQPLRGKYRSGSLVWIEDFTHGVEDMNPDDPDNQGPPGMRGNGSGFFITSDGYLLTNRHVAETDDGFYYRIRLSEKDSEGNFIEYPARFVAADDKYDVALLKVDLPEGEDCDFFYLLEKDVPPVQATVMTAGYPTVGTDNFVLQAVSGTVTSNDTNDEEYDIYLDIKTTQGNSGGPIFDRNGHVIGITTAYRKVFDSIVSLAVGPRQIRDFLSDVDDAPELTYDSETDRPFNGEILAAEVKPKTVLVLIFAGDTEDLDDSKGADSEDGDDGEGEAAPESPPDGPGAGSGSADGFDN